MIMGYDEHYEGGEAGPVASIDFVEKSIQYALSKTTPDKIVIGVPFYGRVWSLDNNRIIGKGTSSKTIQQILESCASTVTYDEKSQSVKAEFTITEGDGTFTVGSNVILEPGNYVVWFENDQSYQAKSVSYTHLRLLRLVRFHRLLLYQSDGSRRQWRCSHTAHIVPDL